VNSLTNQQLQKVIAGCKRKNQKCQEQLYKTYFGYAMAVVMKYVENRQDATDIVDDSFMKVFDAIGKFDAQQPFKPWLRKIMVNTAIDRIRENKKFLRHTSVDKAADLSASVDVIHELTVKEIHGLLRQLPPIQKYIFNMYEIDGYTHQEIAEKLGIPESTSRTYLTRAKAVLRKLYSILYCTDNETYLK
jgi:RNA polymerase sigma-70 factor (ECF subfamily)